MAKNTSYVNLRGQAEWAKLFEDNRETKDYMGDEYANGGWYKVNLHIDEDEYDKLEATNSQAARYAKDSDLNDRMVVLKRPHTKHNKAGELLDWACGAPTVVKADGSAWDYDADGYIPNGSDVECRVCVYKAGGVYGTRLEKVTVIEVAEAEPDYDTV